MPEKEGVKEGVTWVTAYYLCRKCGRKLNRYWSFCPVCGETTKDRLEVTIPASRKKVGK